MSKRSHLNENWYVVGLPWGDGTTIIVGHIDPYIGIFVCDCESWSYDELVEVYSDKWDIASPQELAERIVRDHNECIKLRREIATLEKRLERQRTVATDTEDLFGA